MEELEELGFVGIADYIDSQDDWRSSEWKEFFTVVVDNLLDFLWEYNLSL